MRPLRLLFLSDTHLGFDLPARPRVQRRRRGPDFFAACRSALEPARTGAVDLVVHGGDLLFRSKVPAWLVTEALEPFREVADLDVPVVIVPGNHERSKIPFPLLASHPHVHVIDTPTTMVLRLAGLDVALFGFPFARRIDGPAFQRLLGETRWRDHPADLRLLCLHQAIEGARVGAQDYLFRPGPEVISGRDLPAAAAVLCGHIHRAQVLREDLRGRQLPAPVVYAGSTSRTSFAERRETKGYWMIELVGSDRGGRITGLRFVALPSRPMIRLVVGVEDMTRRDLARRLASCLEALDPDAVVKVVAEGRPRDDALDVLGAPALRGLAPATMNVDLDRASARRLFGPGPRARNRHPP